MQETSTAVVFEAPGSLALREVQLPACGTGDCIVDVEWTGISTGTERLLWDGQMPPFPGLDYPLVPGYETVGRVTDTGDNTFLKAGTRVFVPGSRGFKDVHGLFGGAAKHLVVASDRVVPLPESLTENAILLALAATAVHALNRLQWVGLPDLIVGHGVLGRLLARIAIARGVNDLTVWETEPRRQDSDGSYRVIDPQQDDGSYNIICDVSGDARGLDQFIGQLNKRGTLLLAGFYHQPVQFAFAPAFMRELSLLIAAEWQPGDMHEALELIRNGVLSLDGLITHRFAASDASEAYNTAFSDPGCLKLILDWRSA